MGFRHGAAQICMAAPFRMPMSSEDSLQRPTPWE
jgi:hypothetical protein